MVRTILQAVKPHDKYQLEVKLDYELLNGRETRYTVRTYIFIPQNLGIDESTYSSSRFYSDMHNYIRLKTPSLMLRQFTNGPSSPLTKIRAIMGRENWTVDPQCDEQVVTNLKFMGAMAKSALRDHADLIQLRIAEAPPGSDIGLLVDNLIEEYIVETGNILHDYRKLYAALNLPHVSEQVLTAYSFTDEWLSLQVEEGAVEIFQIVESFLQEQRRAAVLEELTMLTKNEEDYRRSRGYFSILSQDDDNEQYIYRLSVLKKFSSSVLFLTADITPEGQTIEQMLYAFAAGVSMIFATVIAFFAQQQFGQLTFPLFVALVVAYMFKDRIKEGGRSAFARYLQRKLFDRRIVLQTRDRRHRLGLLREKVDFVSEDQVPSRILEMRSRDRITDAHNDGMGEKVLYYTKDVVLYPQAFEKAYSDMPAVTGINDILRYNLRAYLRKMDEPYHERKLLNGTHLTRARCHKVYHLNMISAYEQVQPHPDGFRQRARLILDRKGIKRVELLSESGGLIGGE